MASFDASLDSMPLTIDVALTPALVAAPSGTMPRPISIVIDVVRATTTLVVLFERGCRRVLATRDIVSARRLRTELAREGSAAPLLAGEVGGERPEGFDYGNSPETFLRQDMHGRELIFATTNGTRALSQCPADGVTLAAAFRNASASATLAVAEALRLRAAGRPAHSGDDSCARVPPASPAPSDAAPSEATPTETSSDIVVVCSGRGDRPAYDDTLCAGYLVERLRAAAQAAGQQSIQREGARIAVATWDQGQRSGISLRDLLASSDAGQAVLAIGLEADLAVCAQRDVSRLVPIVTNAAAQRPYLVLEAREGG